MPIPEHDYNQWLTKQQVAKQLGCSTKTVEAFARDRRLRTIPDYKRPTGGARIAIFHPEDVARLADARRDGTPLPVGHVIPASFASPTVALQPRPASAPPSPPPQPSVTPWLEAFLAGLETSQATHAHPRDAQIADLALKLYLTIPEAARLSGFTEARIRRQCREGSLTALKDGGWKIRRADLLAL